MGQFMANTAASASLQRRVDQILTNKQISMILNYTVLIASPTKLYRNLLAANNSTNIQYVVNCIDIS